MIQVILDQIAVGGGNSELPIFSGIQVVALEGNDVRLSWQAGTDNDTDSDQLSYKIFRATLFIRL